MKRERLGVAESVNAIKDRKIDAFFWVGGLPTAAVTDLANTLTRLQPLGATVVDEVVDYEGIYRLCYIRGPEGILIGLAEELQGGAP